MGFFRSLFDYRFTSFIMLRFLKVIYFILVFVILLRGAATSPFPSQITPADSGRQVSIETAPKGSGPWQPIPQSGTTDSGGRFAVTIKSKFSGSIVMRVVVDPAGRYLAVTGVSRPVRLLVLSSIALKGGALRLLVLSSIALKGGGAL